MEVISWNSLCQQHLVHPNASDFLVFVPDLARQPLQVSFCIMKYSQSKSHLSPLSTSRFSPTLISFSRKGSALPFRRGPRYLQTSWNPVHTHQIAHHIRVRFGNDLFTLCSRRRPLPMQIIKKNLPWNFFKKNLPSKKSRTPDFRSKANTNSILTSMWRYHRRQGGEYGDDRSWTTSLEPRALWRI